jgi:hypothetical protein
MSDKDPTKETSIATEEIARMLAKEWSEMMYGNDVEGGARNECDTWE